MNITIETCIDALTIAVMNRRGAIQIELAVGLAVFHSHGGTNRDARRLLAEVYASTGYQCLTITDPDYKTINRRINATAELYEKLPVDKWVGKLTEQNMLRALQEGLKPYEFLSYSDVARFCQPAIPERPAPVHVAPATEMLAPTSNHTGQQKVVNMFRRAADQQDSKLIETDHMVVAVPASATPSEIIEVAMQLLALAKAVDNMVSKPYPSETTSPGETDHERSTESAH